MYVQFESVWMGMHVSVIYLLFDSGVWPEVRFDNYIVCIVHQWKPNRELWTVMCDLWCLSVLHVHLLGLLVRWSHFLSDCAVLLFPSLSRCSYTGIFCFWSKSYFFLLLIVVMGESFLAWQQAGWYVSVTVRLCAHLACVASLFSSFVS